MGDEAAEGARGDLADGLLAHRELGQGGLIALGHFLAAQLPGHLVAVQGGAFSTPKMPRISRSRSWSCL